MNEKRLRRILSVMLNEDEALSDYGIRSISRVRDGHVRRELELARANLAPPGTS